MGKTLYLAATDVTVQGIALQKDDYLVYDSAAEAMSAWLEGPAANPPPVNRPASLLAGLVTSGALRAVPATSSPVCAPPARR